MTEGYRKRLERVMDHITAHLAADLSLDALADVAALSRFHFHRVFTAMQGETVTEAVRRLRMNLAAQRIVTSRDDLAAIAKTCGYPNRDSFERQFRMTFDMTPTQMRRSGQLPAMLIPARKGRLPMYSVRIETTQPMHLAALHHRGAYVQIGETCGQLLARVTSAGFWPQIIGPCVCVYRDDPAVVPVSDLRSEAGLRVAPDTALPEGLHATIIPGGRVARLTLTGPYSQLPAAWAWFYGPWLAESGEEPDDHPSFEIYPNGPQDTPPEGLITYLCLPLKG